MSNVSGIATQVAKEIQLRATVLKRCKCGEGQTGWAYCPSCSRPAVMENLGVVSYYHKSFLKRTWFKIKKGMARVVKLYSD